MGGLIEPMMQEQWWAFGGDGVVKEMHLGVDEVQAVVAPEALVAYLNRLAEVCGEWGVGAQIWADTLLSLEAAYVNQLDPRLHVMYWNYPAKNEEAIHADLQTLAAKGVEVKGVAATTFSHNQFFPLYRYAKDNIRQMVATGRGTGSVDDLV